MVLHKAPPHQIGRFGLGWTTGPAAARHMPCHHTSAPAPAAKATSPLVKVSIIRVSNPTLFTPSIAQMPCLPKTRTAG